MTPVFLPHEALEALDELGSVAPNRERLINLRKLRDQAIDRGAHVLVLIWPTLAWGMLAVETPRDVVIKDARQLVPNVMANPALLEQMHQKAQLGKHLTWLKLEHAPTTH
ncbi:MULTISPECIES: hypothetical protein [Pseudomonas]|uniref:Uncharacterized protein n=1 Tax=Pseudomonas fulva TaxID=47880 RepID=A0A0D0K5V1_9PSED|nr:MULTISPECIES: hypothetical protein [Pseudomonas]KIQ03918.1 hypothetical protein RU08_06065 [Pseudomonas fulva]